jgi:FkbM family methyltransferase
MRRSVQFSLFETVLVALFAALVTWVVVKPRPTGSEGPTLVDQELLQILETRYGGERFSMGPEEWFIRDFFGDQRDGVYVDVGAWDPSKGSNTYRLERDFGWRGVAVDAIAEFAPKYKAFRPRATFFTAFVGDRDEGTATLHLPKRLTAVASGSEAFVNRFTDETEVRQVPRRTLDSLLAEAGVERIDLLSMDIELGEPAALRGFSVDRYRPRLVCIEAHGDTRQAILDYFADHGYVLVGKYLPHDRVNLYFTPRAAASYPAP